MTTEYGKRLKQARKHAGVTQKQLAKISSTPLSTLASAESEGAGSTFTPIWAYHCCVSAYWLATGEGDMLQMVASIKQITLSELDIDLLEQFHRLKKDADQREFIGYLKHTLDSKQKNMQNLQLPTSTKKAAAQK